MIFAVLKKQDFRKFWYEPKIKLNLINSIILEHFLTRRAGRKIKNTQVTRFLHMGCFHSFRTSKGEPPQLCILLKRMKINPVGFKTPGRVLLLYHQERKTQILKTALVSKRGAIICVPYPTREVSKS